MTVYEFRSKTKNIAYSDSLILDKNDLEYFFSYLDTIRLVKMKSLENEKGVDGITVYNTVYQDSIENKFQFWSPDKKEKPVEHRIVEAVIRLSRKKFNDIKHQEYFESLEQYFDFGLPCKKISDNPLEIRMYGSLSSNEEFELNKFINSLPSDKPILVDMTNFGGMGTMFYPLFQSLIKRNNKIIWATEYKNQLKAIGVDTTSIVDNIQEGRIKIKNYCR